MTPASAAEVRAGITAAVRDGRYQPGVSLTAQVDADELQVPERSETRSPTWRPPEPSTAPDREPLSRRRHPRPPVTHPFPPTSLNGVVHAITSQDVGMTGRAKAPPRPRPSRARRLRAVRRLSVVNRWRILVFVLFLAVFITASEMPR
ncbi:hypothetical protein GCM10010371_63810 [Streptomyces subrutilus]|uniref:Uncharacterized protein n=2 Tax=Streptomyces subrutilus TaxID=36818 RepID=A0A918VGR3_9ACTN|nr:hypothetical protein GCM10010371_63810 [Streptomyces subrutilus]